MIWRTHLCFLVALLQISVIVGLTDPNDVTALVNQRWSGVPPSWTGRDPCGSAWDGIACDANNRIVSIQCGSFGLSGQLSSDITGLSQLQILDLSYNKNITGPLPSTIGSMTSLTRLVLIDCGFSGSIPSSIGSLRQLVELSLNLNNFIGGIPPSIGNLSRLNWLDLADNQLTGSFPVSSGNSPGLDMLLNAQHFHFGGNRLSGVIPPQLFSSNMVLIHVLFENNQLTGSIPSSLGLVQTLEVVRLDRNSLSGTVPGSISNLTSATDLYLANNQLSGPLPNLTGMSSLSYVDMSNNSFNPTDIPTWFTSLQSLATVIMENTQIRGNLPTQFFSLAQLQTVALKNNRINGTLDIGPSPSIQMQMVDLENNTIGSFTQQSTPYNFTIILVNNPICPQGASAPYCTIRTTSNSYSTPQNCVPSQCNPGAISSPTTCRCSIPYTGTLVFRSPPFRDFGSAALYESLHDDLLNTSQSLGLPVESVALNNPTKNIDGYLSVVVQFFPSGQATSFNHSGISGMSFMLSNQTFKPPHEFGPFYFTGTDYFSGINAGNTSKSNMGVIIGAAVGGTVLFLLLLLAALYALRQRRRADTADRKNDPFAAWETNSASGAVPQLRGPKSFSFAEIKKCTNNFSDENCIGSGGYGKVYRGNLPNRQVVAIKRAQQGSMQGAHEFKTEIELLSRVHHKNVVSLVGFCFEQGEQMLVYEFIANGTLMDSLSGMTGIRLNWMRRLKIAVGAARGLQYLHDLADPPIIHRDIKSSNILLDEHMNAKVADFGLSKLKGESERGHITTQVKGTVGYLDPEYYMTNQLSEKSDVYSFGVLLFELLTSKSPIEKGKYIVREVKELMDKTKNLYDLQEILDPIVASTTVPKSVEKFVNLAFSCVHELGDSRPTMSEVVKEIEVIMQLEGLNPTSESAQSSATYEGANLHPYNNGGLFNNSVAFPSTTLEPK